MQLSDHFSKSEFEVSENAARRGIDNQIPISLMAEARLTAAMMERIRTELSTEASEPCPIVVLSAFRNLEVNRLAGSSDTSDHPKMAAVDFRSSKFGSPTEIASHLASKVERLGIGQLILEYPDQSGWVHVSRILVKNPVNRILTFKRSGKFVGIVP